MSSELDFPFGRVPFDHPNEECGVIGVFTPEGTASRLAFFGLFSSELCNAQPLLVEGHHGRLAVANNGNIINAVQVKEQLQDELNCTFSSTTDTEVIGLMLANATGATWEDRVFDCMRQLEGAYSIVVQTKDTLIAARDPLGIRPLCLGKLNGGWIVASESCALDHLGAEYLRELEPGEVIDGRLTIACGGGALRVLVAQREGKTAQEAPEFLRGFKVGAGTVLPLPQGGGEGFGADAGGAGHGGGGG